MVPVHAARQIWLVVEPIHAVTYFDDDCRAAAAARGMRGFWMGYFAFRAAPLGPVGPATVEAIFASFVGRMVARALPDAWGHTTPEECLVARRSSAATALRRVGVDDTTCVAACELLEPVVAGVSTTGRPLAAANQALPLPDDPVERLWQLTTTLREHRGDGHVAAHVTAGLSGLDAHLLAVATGDTKWGSRGWDDDERAAGEASLRARGLLDADGGVTATGAARRAEVEARTDEAAWTGGLQALGADGVARVVELLTPAADRAGELLWYPNPIGLPPRG